MKRGYLGALAAFLICACVAAEDVTIHYDDFGIPHIYAESSDAGLYASGWAMARDRLVQTLENYMRGMGRFSSAYGPGENEENVRADLESLMWDHYGKSKEYYERLPEAFRRHNAAFVAGINAWMKDNPDGVPEWWTQGEVDAYMPVAFSRQYIWSWPAGQAADDLKAVGLLPTYDVDLRASNEMAIAPGRTEFGAAALIIDPHLAWFGRQRYWELRLHAGDVHISGFATAGFPYVNLGHNENVAWAHTTGGPDTADVYELTLNPDNPLQYHYDGDWRDLTSKTVSLPVKGEADREITFQYSHHGPIIARQGDKAYAAALAYAEEIGYLESKYLFMVAKNYKDVITALEVRQIMPQNVMVADTDGNIYYQRTGRVPKRPSGYDYARPVDGSTSKTEWQGIHETKDLIHVLNPPQGYMQNCNITPDVMMVDSSMQSSPYPAYIFNQPPMLTHQRATRATEILHTNDSFSIQEVIDLALDQKCYQYERWVEELSAAVSVLSMVLSEDASVGFEKIRAWDGFSRRESNGALVYYYWRHALAELAGEDGLKDIMGRVNNYLDAFGVEDKREQRSITIAQNKQKKTSVITLPRLTPEHQRLLIDALNAGMKAMRERHDSLGAAFGDYFRAGRLDFAGDSDSYPVGGGTLRNEGMSTVRAIGFTDEREDGARWGNNGQTSTQVVILTKPIQSWTQPPIGQSDHPNSPHFRDQAEKLLGPGTMKPSWFNKPDLLDGHVKETITIEYSAP